MKKEIVMLILCLIFILLILANTLKNKFVFVNNDKLNICQKCAIIDGNYYCQTFGLESDK